MKKKAKIYNATPLFERIKRKHLARKRSKAIEKRDRVIEDREYMTAFFSTW